MKVVLNFANSSTKNQTEIAILPASFAKKLLQNYAKQLNRANPEEIIRDHINELHNLIRKSKAEELVDNCIEASKSFIQERAILNNILEGKLDSYIQEIPMEIVTKDSDDFPGELKKAVINLEEE